MNINDLIKQAHENAKEKGWHDKEVSFGDYISNFHGEVSEVWEEYRNGKELNESYFECKEKTFCCKRENGKCASNFPCKEAKPCGIPTELADILIRIFDFCGKHNIDLEKAIELKMEFNKTRPYRHNNKVV